LHRTAETGEVDGPHISVKCGLARDRLVTATPEFADVARAAAALGCSERAVLTAANHNFSLIRSDYQLASHSRQSDRSTPAGRSHRTASMKSTSTNVIGRIRHSVKTEPSILQCRNVLCHKDVRRTVDDQILEQPVTEASRRLIVRADSPASP
jgi:hypothetical protein